MSALDWSAVFATRTERMRASEIRELLKLLDQPDIISFAGGIPDPSLFPVEAIRDAQDAILADPVTAAQALQYSVSEGFIGLRRWIVGHMAATGVPCDVDNILITCGSQQGLDFLGKLLLSPGDTALVEAPTYLGALQAFNAYEPRWDTLNVDGGNRTPAAYADAAAAATPGGRVKFAYVVPDFANPTGLSLSVESRKALLALAAELEIPVIEDAAYRQIAFDGEPLPAILALDCAANGGDIDKTRTVYCGTFSKTLVPAMRVGWIVAARPIIEKLVLTKQAGDLHSSTLAQMTMARVAETTFDANVLRARALYRGRRDALMAALAASMPAGVGWTKPKGGLFAWVTLPEGIDGAELLAHAIAEERVAFVPGGAFFAEDRMANTIRLNFSLPNESAIAEGIGRLGRLIGRRAA
ncbi:PLP-dependent aminotransferase family protein [Siculibacillus lacustris]|uniref:PLP-dependent aminotransferase family protein n=1 Tax=Siculibacillus lacustris TaxID=1549641 RepID=A0A4Q9VMR9_9HYPH|nr:PLP-dependent aminotransferase family protein [Siculibacillus lacustris]TBW35974.1 PLP-dependent aminotransferase family protein [Siculibacillus lacustris]